MTTTHLIHAHTRIHSKSLRCCKLQVAGWRLQAASCLWGRKSQLRRDLNASRVNVKPRLGFARLERSRSSGQIWPNARYGYVLPIVPHLT